MSSLLERVKKPRLARHAVEVTLSIDGRGHLFYGRAADTINDPNGPPGGRRFFFESINAGNFAAFLTIMDALYRAAGYHGHIDSVSMDLVPARERTCRVRRNS